MALSRVRFDVCVGTAFEQRGCDGKEFNGFENVVLEYVFTLPRSERGTVDRLTISHGLETERGMVDRMARVDVEMGHTHHYFYVFAEASTHALQEWRLIGRTARTQQKPLVMPTFDEVSWF